MEKLEDKFINLIINNLPKDKLSELEILMEVGDKKKIQEFIGALIPDIEAILEKIWKSYSDLEREF